MKLNKKTLTISSIILITTIIIILISRHSGLSRINTPLPDQILPEQNLSVTQVTTSIPTPNNFIWQIDHLKLPKEIQVVSVKPNTQGKTILKNLSTALNLTNGPQTIPNSPIIFYSNPQESATIYLNQDENLINFTFSLLQNPIPQDSQDPPLTTLLPQLAITKASTHYQTLNGPRFVTTTKDQATLITTNYNYQHNNLPILFPNGNSIEETRSLSGKLVKLSLNLPPTISSHSARPPLEELPRILPVKTIQEIKNTPRSQFTTIALSGNQKFQLSDQEINIDTAHLNNGFLGYIHHQNTLIPHIFLTGTTQDPNYGQIELLLATPATE